MKIPNYSFQDLVITKARGGKKALWHARFQSLYSGVTALHKLTGSGNTADNAIRDWQKQFRHCVKVRVLKWVTNDGLTFGWQWSE